ncbi:ATP-binding cassette domain-containing protein [Halorussus litoreus]|uniref:hypothetical protein n=1 Tax=Halorussus litoreus TaxID=1710536 RepID=UPI000E2683FF|nr:hypothetical protein [Halorussus litoreus]
MFDRIADIHAAGKTAVLVEQDVSSAATVADRVYTLSNGHITAEHAAEEVDPSELSAFRSPDFARAALF